MNQCGPFKVTRPPPLSQVKLHDSPICTPVVILDRKKCPLPLRIPETIYISLKTGKSVKIFGFYCCAKTLKIPVFASNYFKQKIFDKKDYGKIQIFMQSLFLCNKGKL